VAQRFWPPAARAGSGQARSRLCKITYLAGVAPARKNATVVASAQRTLVKSAPEIWQLVESEELARAWLAELTGTDGTVEVVARAPERALTWRAGESTGARLEFALDEKGFGTQVSIASDADDSGDVLDRVMDQLAEPERRPFARD
jgi:hypothetical protein